MWGASPGRGVGSGKSEVGNQKSRVRSTLPTSDFPNGIGLVGESHGLPTPYSPFPAPSIAAECLAQRALGALQHAQPRLGQVLAGTVDVEVEHRHGRLERRGLAAVARLGRLLERLGNGAGAPLGEHLVLQVE